MSGALQMFAGLALVLGAIAGAAWLARRFGAVGSSNTGFIKNLGALAVGPKERVVVVEIEGQRYILGVAPGRVSVTHAPR